MSQIFKVYNCSITENTITTIYVFVGYDNEKYQSEFMANNKADIFKNIFTEVELKRIDDKKIPVLFINHYLNIDDSINIIKLKIVSAIQSRLAKEEIYLFYESTTNIKTVDVYNKLKDSD